MGKVSKIIGVPAAVRQHLHRINGRRRSMAPSLQDANTGKELKNRKAVQVPQSPNSRKRYEDTVAALRGLMQDVTVFQGIIPMMFKEDGFDVNARDVSGASALMLAVAEGLEAVVRQLLQNGADVNVRANNGWTPIMYAAAIGSSKIAKQLIDAKADVNIQGLEGMTALMIAVSNDDEVLVNQLLDAGADVELRNAWQVTALQMLPKDSSTIQFILQRRLGGIQKARITEIAKLLGADAELRQWIQPIFTSGKATEPDGKQRWDAKGQNEDTALSAAVLKGRTDIVKLLLAAGATVDAPVTHSATPLMLAAKKNYIEVQQVLLYYGADVNAQDANGWTPIMYAVLNQHITSVDYLLKAQANVHTVNHEGQTVFGLAFERENPCLGIIDALLRRDAKGLLAIHGPGLLVQFIQNWTPQSEAYIELLLDYGADVHAKDTQSGLTAIECAKKAFKLSLLQDYMNRADVNRYNKLREYLNEHNLNAWRERVFPVVNGTQGYNLNACDDEGWTLLTYAAKEDNIELVRLLIYLKADKEVPCPYGKMTALMLAINNGSDWMVELLVEAGAVVNTQDQEGRTPLMYAIQQQSADMVTYLVHNGANIEAKDTANREVWDWAKDYAMTEVLEEAVASRPAKGLQLNGLVDVAVSSLCSIQ